MHATVTAMQRNSPADVRFGLLAQCPSPDPSMYSNWTPLGPRQTLPFVNQVPTLTSLVERSAVFFSNKRPESADSPNYTGAVLFGRVLRQKPTSRELLAPR